MTQQQEGDTTLEINTLATKLQNDTFSRSEIARRLHALIAKAREEGKADAYINVDTKLAYEYGKLAGRIATLKEVITLCCTTCKEKVQLLDDTNK